MIDTNSAYSANNFTPDPGYLFVHPIKPTIFEKEVSDGQPRKGEILKIGANYINEHGLEQATIHKIGEIIYYIYNYTEINLDNEDYHIVPFGAVKGSFNG